MKQLIHDLYGIDMPLRNVSNYLDRWGADMPAPNQAFLHPERRAEKELLGTGIPPIAKRAKKEREAIYGGDETGINNHEYHIRGFSPKGTAPVQKVNPKLEKINMISAISSRGACRFKCYGDSMTQQRFIDFMRRLVKDTCREVFFTVDNRKVHHGKLVKAWLEENKNKIEVFNTPTCSPDLNPDEYLNNMLKQSVHSGGLPRTKNDLRKRRTPSCAVSRIRSDE